VRVCVISDIHGNAAALEAVLDAIAREAPDAVWCLGDIVGYGPRPNECCQIVAERADVCLSGNHDLGVLGEISLADFHGDAAASALWTREVLGDAEHEFLVRLEPMGLPPGGAAELYHGSPRDPIWEYILTGEAARAALEDTKAPVVMVGHSHVALAVSLADGRVSGGLAPDATNIDLTVARWLLNPGSVGQPRDGDPRAAYVVLDLERRFAVFRRVAYSIETTQSEIRERGLPESLAARLATGG
jgi:predicted phosphodiesterase